MSAKNFTMYSFIISAIKALHQDWQKFIFTELSGARTVSNDFLEHVAKGHYNKFEIGSKVEVCDKHNLLSVCVATIVDIVGDRLRLRYDGLDEDQADDYWAHFLSTDIHPVGWSQLVGHTLSPPHGMKFYCVLCDESVSIRWFFSF